jgi:hypothetical protein
MSITNAWVSLGFADSQEAYNPYPNALLSLRYITEVGKMVIGDSFMDADEVKEAESFGEPDQVVHAVTFYFLAHNISAILNSIIMIIINHIKLINLCTEVR